MKAIFIVLLATCSVAALANDFSGYWKGTGYVTLEDSTQPERALFDLALSVVSDRLEIWQCWSSLDHQPDGDHCLQSLYEVKDGSEIWIKDQKVGDIFPFAILIFQGNTQVSESFKFELSNQGRLRATYNYANLDGNSSHSQAVLERQP